MAGAGDDDEADAPPTELAGRSAAPDGDLTGIDPPLADQATAIGRRAATPVPRPPGSTTPVPRSLAQASAGGSLIFTAADAMRDEEVPRTRLFIRLGWAASIGGLATIPIVGTHTAITIAFAAALVLGMVVSCYFHQSFRDPNRYGPRPLFVLGVMSAVNTHVAILYFGALTLAPVLIVIGLHFVARSELAARRAVWISSAICHALIMIGIIAGPWDDPGVFATARPLGGGALAIGGLYVQAAYALAYATGRIQRKLSLRSIEQLQRATRIGAQRAALLDELRADLERAHQAGAGRHTDEIVGGWVLGGLLGRGAYGEVYAAVRQGDDAPAAVKLLHRDRLADPTAVARFLREVQATAAVASPNIVRVLATSAPEDPLPFMAMERLSGMTLADKLRRTPALPVADVQALVAQVGAAIDAARAAAIVHRDLKPQNLFLADGTWKVLDFGVAALGASRGTLTAGEIVGTPQYMAPEQARGGAVDHRADLYALGVIAYRALTGRNPFGGPDAPAVLYAVVHAMPEAPTALAELPGGGDLDAWTACALAKDAGLRWETGADLAKQLAAAVRGELEPAARERAARILAKTPWRSGT